MSGGVAVLVVAGAVAYLGWTEGWDAGSWKGHPAPAFLLRDHEGRPVALTDYLGRKPVVLVFYMSYGMGDCRVQLGKLRASIGNLISAGAEVFAISNDGADDARRMAEELRFEVPILSDPSLDVIYRYSMKGHGMTTAEMGYVLIDAAGRVRRRTIDRRFGDHAVEILQELQRVAGAPGK